jgi:hypothetical protein
VLCHFAGRKTDHAGAVTVYETLAREMIGRVTLSSIGAGLALFVAVRSHNETIQAAAALVGSSCLGFTTTTLVLKQRRDRKNREANAEVYIEMLRQLNHPPRPPIQPPRPAACLGCCHYHGQTYGGTRLICAMHPYGTDDEHCVDWQESEGPDDEFSIDELGIRRR